MREPREIIRRGKKFLLEVRAEAKKASWGTRRELADSTVVVLFVFLVTALFVGMIDRLTTWGVINGLLKLLRGES